MRCSGVLDVMELSSPSVVVIEKESLENVQCAVTLAVCQPAGERLLWPQHRSIDQNSREVSSSSLFNFKFLTLFSFFS